MIEIFKSRRYIGLCIVLVVVCLIVMIMEGLFTTQKPSIAHDHDVLIHNGSHGDDVSNQQHNVNVNDKDSKSSGCWLHEDFHIITRCSKCPDIIGDEAKAANMTACKKTGYIEQLRCKSGIQVIRSCVHESALMSFFKFELIMLMVAAIGYFYCHRRESWLRKAAMDRINKQLFGGV